MPETEPPDAREVLELGLEGWQRLPLVDIFRKPLREDRDAGLRAAAARVLAMSRDIQAVEHLKEAATHDADATVQAEATIGLRRLRRETSGHAHR